MTKRLSHGMGLDPVEPDWPALTAAEVRALLADFPAAGDEARLTWHSPRPFSAAALVESPSGTLFVKRHSPRVRTADMAGGGTRLPRSPGPTRCASGAGTA
ncbi:MAG: hypothetical protein QM805_29165 [Pseudomonas sp.]